MTHLYQVHNENENGGLDYAVGDIHGCYTQLLEFLEEIYFDYEVDRLYSVGDLCDRGPESERMLEFLEKPWFFAVRGNDDQFAVQYMDMRAEDQALMGMFEAQYTAQGGGWNVDAGIALSEEIASAVEAMPLAIEYNGFGKKLVFVHADIPNIGWEATKHILEAGDYVEINALAEDMMWSRKRVYGERTDFHKGIDYAVVGHTTLDAPGCMENTLYLDTGAVYGGGFTILRISDMTLLRQPSTRKD